VLCGEPVEPGSIPGPHSVSLPGPTEWEVTVHGQVDALFGMVGQKVSVRAVTTTRDGSVRTGFGIAIVTAVTADGDEGKATLLGSDALGEMA